MSRLRVKSSWPLPSWSLDKEKCRLGSYCGTGANPVRLWQSPHAQSCQTAACSCREYIHQPCCPLRIIQGNPMCVDIPCCRYACGMLNRGLTVIPQRIINCYRSFFPRVARNVKALVTKTGGRNYIGWKTTAIGFFPFINLISNCHS